MIGDISLASSIYIITGYTDMRKSIDGLYALVMDKLHEEPDRFSIYLFCGRRSDIICQNKFCVSLEFQMAKTYIEFTLTNCFSHIFMIYLP